MGRDRRHLIRRGAAGRAAAVRAGALALAALALLHGGPAPAREGHPLKGSWIGEWQSNEAHGENVLVILDWDGERITGMINPGTDDIEIARATLDPEDWTVRIEADAAAEDGTPLHYVVEGRIEELELPNRRIVGSWRHQSAGGAFEIQRQ